MVPSIGKFSLVFSKVWKLSKYHTFKGVIFFKTLKKAAKPLSPHSKGDPKLSLALLCFAVYRLA